MATQPSLSVAPDGVPGFPADAIEVGCVIGAWGLKGSFKVLAHAGDPQALFSSKRWFLKAPVGARGQALPAILRIAQAREQGGVVVASARDIEDRDAAQALTGARIFVPRSSFPSVGDHEYYWVDLIGLAVLNREGAELGVVTDLIDTGVHSVLRMRRPDAAADAAPQAAERLIPFVAAYIDSVDLDTKTIRVDWGLDY